LSKNARVAGHRVAYEADGEGAPVVLIHGTPSHSFIWRKIWPDLAGAGYRVYRYDLLGFGASERPRDPAEDTSVAAQEKLLASLLDGWGEAEVHLVAHDIGGAVALRLAPGTTDPAAPAGRPRPGTHGRRGPGRWAKRASTSSRFATTTAARGHSRRAPLHHGGQAGGGCGAAAALSTGGGNGRNAQGAHIDERRRAGSDHV